MPRSQPELLAFHHFDAEQRGGVHLKNHPVIFVKKYHLKDEAGNSTTTERPMTTPNPESCDDFKTDESCELDESNIIKVLPIP